MGLHGLRSQPSDRSVGRRPLVPIGGNPPSPAELPPRCPFTPRCPMAIEAVRAEGRARRSSR
ncbi:hypothetical protein [Nonomuraea dietziae]|uniref:ABC transporter ATP-binding protein n=1 Tax=Nonomuraea dietziae TaxID=65515 RepID=UPI0031D01DAC